MKKNFSPVTAGCREWQYKAFPAGKYSASFGTPERDLLRFGRCSCSKFQELSALPEIFRLHRAEDGLSMELESSGVIPFGQEFQIERTMTLANGSAAVKTLCRALNGGQVGDITLEMAEFPAPWQKAEYLVYGDKKLRTAEFAENKEYYCGEEPPWYVHVYFPDGNESEFMLGSDIWRHRSAGRMEGVNSEFRLADVGGALILERNILRYGAETPVEKRPWQFEALLAWSVPEKPCPGNMTALPVPGCLSSRKVQGKLRSAVRSAAAPFSVTGYSPDFCSDSSHLERTGKKELEHLDVADLFQFHLWANRQLKRKDLCLTLGAPEGILKNSLILKNLGYAPIELDEFYDE